MPAAERLDEPFPIFVFSRMVTWKPRSARRTAIRAFVEPPPIRTTWSTEECRMGRGVFMTRCSFLAYRATARVAPTYHARQLPACLFPPRYCRSLLRCAVILWWECCGYKYCAYLADT